MPALVGLCRELAAYERARWEAYDRVAALEALFLGSSDAWCWVLDSVDETERGLCGFASAFVERSTWAARPFLHMDCLFLRAGARGRGLGLALVGAVTAKAVELGVREVQWQTPAWNDSASRFYDRLGAQPAEKVRYTLDIDGIEQLGSKQR